MRAEDAHRPARLHQQRLVVFERLQRAHDGVEALPVARRPAGAAIDDQVARVLADLRVEVVHQHAQGGFLLPALAGDLAAARRALRDIGAGDFRIDRHDRSMLVPGRSGRKAGENWREKTNNGSKRI